MPRFKELLMKRNKIIEGVKVIEKVWLDGERGKTSVYFPKEMSDSEILIETKRRGYPTDSNYHYIMGETSVHVYLRKTTTNNILEIEYEANC